MAGWTDVLGAAWGVSDRDLIDRFNVVQGEVNATRMSTFRGFCG